MSTLYIMVAAVSFFMHLVFEGLASFVKYNFSSLGRHMTGISLSNILAISSRGCVAIFGVSIAIVIERSLSTVVVYNYVFSVVMVLGAAFTFFLSKHKIDDRSDVFVVWGTRSFFKNIKTIFIKNNDRLSLPLNKLIAILMGTQFVAVVIAYGLCFVLPGHRLLITSMVPLVSMLGTLVTIIFVEPALARLVDANNKTGYAASSEFLRARAISFIFCAGLLPIVSLAIANFQP